MTLEYSKIKQHFENTFPQDLFEDFVVCSFGDDAKYYAETFELSEQSCCRYERIVMQNTDFFKNETVVDIGSSVGFWSLCVLLNGAHSVTCLEPNQQHVNSINRFGKKHNLNIDAVCGLHSDIDQLEDFSTVMFTNMDDMIIDYPCFFSKLVRMKNIKKIFIASSINEELPENATQIQYLPRLTHRNGIDMRSGVFNNTQSTRQSFLDNNTHADGFFMSQTYGPEYHKSMFEYNKTNLIKELYDKDFSNLVGSFKRNFVYYWIEVPQ